jgi:glutamate--cysteine ligase
MDEANISFEPGGQIELSLAPDADVKLLLRRLATLVERTNRALSTRGLVASPTGTDAWRTNRAVGLQKQSERYLRMQEHFDHIGPWGRRMMRQTAGLQVCVGLERGRGGREQWLLANLMAPVLQAMFANSPALEARRTGFASTRSAIWQRLDPSRTGFAEDWYLGDPATAYLGFAMAATRIPIEAALDPIATHLSTLFPPVRPRGDYLELRCLDAVPMDRIRIAVDLVSRLLLEQDLRRAALDFLSGRRRELRQGWTRAAHHGLADPALRRLADGLLERAALNSALELAA